jgi:ribosomal protein S18 acetylase RimI-like enzyme
VRFGSDGKMPYVSRHAAGAEDMFKQDPSGLRTCEVHSRACPLEFQLVPSALALGKTELDTCVDLIQLTSGFDYEHSSIGWNRESKRTEMLDKDMMYLLIRQGAVPVGPKFTAPTAQEALLENVEHVAPEVEQVNVEHVVSEIEQKNIEHPTQEAREDAEHVPPPSNSLRQLMCDYASDSNDQTVPAPVLKREDEDSAPRTVPKKRKADPAPARSRKEHWIDTRKEIAFPDPNNTGRVLGFISFMFTGDEPPHGNREVLYIYEIHLHERLRGFGLGSQLVDFVEHTAKHCGVSKTMLTVFCLNDRARELYKKLGYKKDACSPPDRKVRSRMIEAEYVIMSKELV